MGRGHVWIPDPDASPQPGEAPDAAVAETHGVCATTVWKYRHRHGIPVGDYMGRPKGSGWQPDGDPMPGADTDAAVAEAHTERTGRPVSASTVQRWRVRRGIPAFGAQG